MDNHWSTAVNHDANVGDEGTGLSAAGLCSTSSPLSSESSGSLKEVIVSDLGVFPDFGVSPGGADHPRRAAGPLAGACPTARL